MPKKQSTKQRTQVKDLPRKKKELSKAEQKKVKGGTLGSQTGWTDPEPSPWTDPDTQPVRRR